MPSFVYVLATTNPSGRIITYVGWTLDLERRLAEHNGKSSGAKYHDFFWTWHNCLLNCPKFETSHVATRSRLERA